ncbi:hypothetical protein BGW39_003596 [Mortierella sp. 14UC]|nr:hypothetical protein BGW39_003596 [Mortierella sp. 14UC]
MNLETIMKTFVLPVLPGASVESIGGDSLVQSSQGNHSQSNHHQQQPLQQPNIRQVNKQQANKQQANKQQASKQQVNKQQINKQKVYKQKWQQKKQQQRGRADPEVHPQRSRNSITRARSVAVTASAVRMKLGKKAHRYAGPGPCEGYDFTSVKLLDGNFGADVQDRYKIQQKIRKLLGSAEHSR